MTTLVQISVGQSAKEVTANENFSAVSPAGIFGKKHTTTTGLTFGFYGGIMRVDGVLTTVSDGTVALTAGSTNFVEATRAGVVSTNTTAFTAGRIPLWQLITSASTITTFTDQRAWIEPSHVSSYLSKSFPSDANMTLTAAEAAVRNIRIAGTISTTRNVVVPLNGDWLIHNNTSGSPSNAIQIIGATGTGITIAHSKTAMVYADGTNINRGSADV